MLVLGIETSCDDTSVALVEDGRWLRANQVSSQIEVHSRFGGVVPELAAREHLTALPVVLEAALDEARVTLKDIDAIAVTYGPGLLGALLVGLAAAKSLSLSLDVPYLGVNHLQAHLFANFLTDPGLEPPFLGLVISGGHTLLLDVPSLGEFEVLGRTVDDAAGECLDKVARRAGLPFPGGKYVEELALQGRPDAVALPRPRTSKQPLNFSFSGLKTAAVLALHKKEASLPDMMASFQQAVIDCVRERTLRALDQTGRKRLVMAGGVTANRSLLRHIEEDVSPLGVTVSCPPPRLCTDNGAMIAALGAARLALGQRSDASLNAVAALPPEQP